MSTNLKILQTYWRAAWKYPASVIGVFVSLTATIIVLEFLPPLIIARVFDRLSEGDYASGDVWGSFGSELLAYAALIVAGGVIGWRVIIWIVWRLEAKVVRDLFKMQYDHLLKLSAKFHANSFGGSIVSHTNKFAHNYIRLADTLFFQMYTLFLAFATTAIILWSRSPQYVLILTALSIIFILMAVKMTRRLRTLIVKEASAHNKSTGVLADGISNIMAVKSFAADTQESNRYTKALEKFRSATHDVIIESTIKEAYFSISTTTISIAAVTMAVISVVVYGAQVGTVFLIFTYTTNITRRLWEFSQNTLKNLNKGLGDAQDGMLTLMTDVDVEDPENPEMLMIHEGQISIEHMDFAHKDEKGNKSLFTDFNLSIEAGEKIGLVGHSGSGKSSLVSLLLRFSDIDAGSIKIDGQNIANITQNDLRKNIAYVPQEPLLFHRSIAENISYGSEESSEKDIIKAAKQANAHEFVKDLVEGYGTLVGERGVKLSGGQRQRIAIARALVKDAPILLLDEATSALDSESEQLIQDALWKLMEGRTALVIAHRLSTIQKMDRILVMENGQIIEEGSHKELLKKKGKYAELWAHQSGGFIEE